MDQAQAAGWDKTTEALVGFAQRSTYAALSPAVVHAVKLRVIDCFASALGAYENSISELARNTTEAKTRIEANAEHLYLEASRLAFADRDAYLADPEYVDAPIEGMLSKQFAAQRRSLIRPDKAAGVVPAGDAFLYENDQSFPLRPQQKLIQEGTHTTHLTVAEIGRAHV